MTPPSSPPHAPRPDLRAVGPDDPAAGIRPAAGPQAAEEAGTGTADPADTPEARRAARVSRRAERVAAVAAAQQAQDAAAQAQEDDGENPPAKRRRRRRKRGAGAPAELAAATPPAPAPAPARIRPRHWLALASLVLCVLAPLVAATVYLYTRAADQYHSETAFSIRSEEASGATAGILGALTQIGTGSASDADILFQFIRSPEIVREIDAELDLRAIYNRAEGDPVFTLGDDPSIEALLAHWERMVEVSLDATAGIIHVRANAFTPEDARAIATAILAHSSDLVNRLSDQARSDAVRFASEELAEAEENLRQVRQNLADFRRRYNIVDPTADVAGQSGLLSALNQELAQALVDRDVLLSYAAEDDQRVQQANRRITAITGRIEEERSSLDLTGLPGSLPDVVGAYEELLVDMEFANTAYVQTLAGLTAARGEARRQSRYLAAHIEPTLASTSLYPRRAMLAGLAGVFLLLGWGVLMLIYYNIRDNR
jgi:capsular polysaccharide transport system permease protein